MKSRLNNIWLGMVLGIIVPVITIFVVNLIRFDEYTIGEYFKIMFERKILSSMISLCAIPNLLVFLIFIWMNKLYSARGVLASTFILGFIIIGIKFLL